MAKISILQRLRALLLDVWNARPTTVLFVTHNLREAIQLADRLGVDSRLWFEGMRLDNTRFDDEPPVYLSYRQACQIIRRALASLPGQGHGLTVGRAQGVGRFGLLGLAMMTAEDFGEALRMAMQFAAITGALMELEIDTQAEDQGRPGVAMAARMGTPEPDLEPFLCEELFASSLMLCRGLLATRPDRATAPR